MRGFLTRDERAVMLFLAGAVAVGSIVLGLAKVDPAEYGRGDVAREEAVAVSSVDVPLLVDLNSADAPELERLPGIGPAKASAIVELRATRGVFKSVDELDDVKGIGPATLERVRPFVVIRGDSTCGRSADPTVEEPERD